VRQLLNSFCLPHTVCPCCPPLSFYHALHSHSLSCHAASTHSSCVALADFGIISYSFSRIAATIRQDTPFAISPNVALLCFFPMLVFVVLLFAYRYIQHPVFSYQRDGPTQVGGVPTRNDPSVPGNSDTTVETEEREETVAEATAGRLLPCIFRMVVGLSAFDAMAVTKGGDEVLPGALPARYRDGGCRLACGFKVYRLLWWYWQALKRNHSLLAPFLAHYDPRRGHGHYSSILLARYG